MPIITKYKGVNIHKSGVSGKYYIIVDGKRKYFKTITQAKKAVGRWEKMQYRKDSPEIKIQQARKKQGKRAKPRRRGRRRGL